VSHLQVPDAVGEIAGWRAWKVISLGRTVWLGSVVSDAAWPRDRYFVATCAGNTEDEHGVPVESCGCGIYAARDRDLLLEMAYGHYEDSDDVRVIGEVALSGKVIVATRGYRAARARQAIVRRTSRLAPRPTTRGLRGPSRAGVLAGLSERR
jgi:hypothetical protein